MKSWNPVESIKQTAEQSIDSFKEQQLALSMGVRAVDNYSRQFGDNKTYTKGVLINGAPGAGKTFVSQITGLYAMSQGLRVLSSSLMAKRVNALGGYNLHRLFGWIVGSKENLFREAEVSISVMALW